MKKQIELFYEYGSQNKKPSCLAVDQETKEEIAYCTRDSWEEAEKAAIGEVKKHFTYGPPPDPKVIEIEIAAPEPVELSDIYKTNVILIVPGLRVRIIAPGHECESNVGYPAMSGECVRIVMHKGYKLVRPDELEAI